MCWGWAHECNCLQKSEGGSGSPGARVTGGCALLDVGAGT